MGPNPVNDASCRSFKEPKRRGERTDKRSSVASPSSCLLATSLAERGGRALPSAAQGATENALVVDGRLRTIDEELEFSFEDPRGPWRVRAPSGRVDLEVTTIYARTVGADLFPLGARLQWAFGSFRGVVDESRIDGLRGFIERFRARW